MKITYKALVFSSFLTILSWTSAAQLTDTSIITKSQTVYLDYWPTEPISKTAITFVKFKDGFGIQFSFVTFSKNINHEIVDSFMLDLSSNKRLVLNHPYRDTIYIQSDGGYFWQIIYFIDKRKFEELLQNKIEAVLVAHGSRPLKMRLRKKSQTKIIEAATSF